MEPSFRSDLLESPWSRDVLTTRQRLAALEKKTAMSRPQQLAGLESGRINRRGLKPRAIAPRRKKSSARRPLEAFSD